MIEIQTHSRLHFGLLHPAPPETSWPTLQGQLLVPSRRFGGAGLMVREPSLTLRLEEAGHWRAEGPLAQRALGFVTRVVEQLSRECPSSVPPPHRIHITTRAREHVGLGVGTQLGLAVARALAALAGLDPDLATLARWAGRGARSALGVHGFAQGGFLVDGGKQRETLLAPLLVRLAFPETWPILLAFPGGQEGVHGQREREAFRSFAAGCALRHTEALCRLVLLGMLPALLERDIQGFGEALYDFNRRVGDLFAPFQGGPYASPAVTAAVDWLRARGGRGVGQSSWGPCVFAVTDDEALAHRLAAGLVTELGLAPDDVLLTQAAGHGYALRGPWPASGQHGRSC